MRNRGFEICNGFETSDIKLPIRKTKHSVCYDICAAEDTIIPSLWKIVFHNITLFLSGKQEYLEIKPTMIPTGIKSYFQEDEVLILANKSSFPIKKGLIFANSIGIIDSDYYNNDQNEGCLQFLYYNIFFKDVMIKKGESAGQGYFQKFLKTDDDDASGIRKGGFGSTGS